MQVLVTFFGDHTRLCVHATRSVIGFRLGVLAKLAAPRTEKHSRRDMELKRALHELELYLRVSGWVGERCWYSMSGGASWAA